MSELDVTNIQMGEHFEGEYYVAPALYNTDLSAVFVTDNINDKFLSDKARTSVQQDLREIGKLSKYGDFCYVAKLAEEFAHFVQHTRGELPNIKNLPQVSSSNNVSIEPHDVRMDQDRIQLTQLVMERVFQEMSYSGYPPIGGVVVVNGEIRLFGANSDYLKDHHAYVHYSHKYPHEQEAKDIQSRVLIWWFTEYEKMPFKYTLGKK